MLGQLQLNVSAEDEVFVADDEDEEAEANVLSEIEIKYTDVEEFYAENENESREIEHPYDDIATEAESDRVPTPGTKQTDLTTSKCDSKLTTATQTESTFSECATNVATQNEPSTSSGENNFDGHFACRFGFTTNVSTRSNRFCFCMGIDYLIFSSLNRRTFLFERTSQNVD